MITEYGVEYEIWLSEPNGTRIQLLDGAASFSAIRVVNGIGYWTVELPADFGDSLLRLDDIVEIWRKPAGGAMRLFLAGFLRKWTYTRDQIIVSGLDLNYLLTSRIVAYAAGSSQADKTDYADDMMKELVAENLGASATDTDRDWSAYLSTAADLSNGPSLTKSFAWRDLYRTLLDIAQSAREAGTAVYFDIVKTGTSSLEFRTFTGQPGVDNTYPSGANPVIFGLEFGNLDDPTYTIRHNEEVTYVYAGGQGEEGNREIVEVEAAIRGSASIWARREAFRDARNEDTTAGVTAAGRAELQDGRPEQVLRAQLLDSEQTRFGRDWNFGDRVTVTFAGKQFDGLVSQVSISVEEGGKEDIVAIFDVNA